MKHLELREVPCGVCRHPLYLRTYKPTAEGAPEVLNYDGGFFAIYQGTDGTVGMVVCCDEKCAEQLSSGTPVMVSTIGQA